MLASSALENRLCAASLDKQPAGISVYVYEDGEFAEAGVNRFDISAGVAVGCVTKVLTASLVAIAQADGKLHLDSSLGDCLADPFAPLSNAEIFTSVQVGHLLNHTSGLDGSNVISLPHDAKGFIDSDALLLSLLQSPRLFRSGQVFNYGSIGSWLAAAALERAYGLPYAVLLDELLLQPLQIAACRHVEPTAICPSLGRDLRISASDLMKLLLWHMQGDPGRPELTAVLRSFRSEFRVANDAGLDGYRGVHPCWFDFGGSFGHIGYSANTSAVVRFLPERNLAIAITAGHAKLASATLGILFHKLLPDLARARPARPLDAEQWAAVSHAPYTGVFENARYRLCVDTANNGALRVKVFRKSGDCRAADEEPYIKRYLRAMANDSFFPLEPEPLVCPRLQFSHQDAGVGFRYASTGRYVFARTA